MSPEKAVYVNQTGIFSFFQNQPNVGWNRLNLWKELKQASRILDLGFGNHPLEIYAALSAAFMPVA